MVSLRSRCSTAIEMHPIRCQKTMEIGFHYRTTQCSASVSSYNQPVQRIYGTKRILNYHAWERNCRESLALQLPKKQELAFLKSAAIALSYDNHSYRLE